MYKKTKQLILFGIAIMHNYLFPLLLYFAVDFFKSFVYFDTYSKKFFVPF